MQEQQAAEFGIAEATRVLGEMIMKELRNLDKVAYVRFASVYLDFKDVQEFMSELKDLLKGRE